MAVTMSTGHAIGARWKAWAWALAAATCVFFGVMAVEFNFALRGEGTNWWAALQARMTGEVYSLGPASAHAMYPTYRRALAAMSSHTALGGIALSLAVLQFVPALRRRWRLAHRAIGALVMVGVAVSMLGALTYLARTPLSAIYASPAFGLGLWALALACLAYLALAVLAIRRRDYRSHMGFMALMMSTLLTAPVLRFEWTLFGIGTGYTMSEVNQGVVTSLAVLCTLVMSLWMHHIGAADLPARRRECVPSLPWLSLYGYGAAAVIVHEGLCAPLGLDLLDGWRGVAERLPPLAAAWAVPGTWLALRVRDEVARVLDGQVLTAATRALLVAVAVASLALAAQQGAAGVDAIGLRFYWTAVGLLTLGLLAAAGLSTRSDEPWSLMMLFFVVAPVLWPALWLVAWLCAQSFTVAMWFAATVALAAMSANAFMSAFALRLPWGARQRA